MARDYLPRPDGEFDAGQANFVTCATANAAALGLDPLVDIPPLATGRSERIDVSGNRHAHAVRHQLRQRRRQQGRSLYVEMGIHPRRNRPVVRIRQRHDWGVNRMVNSEVRMSIGFQKQATGN